ncbi:hypothetical protein HHI36_017560 [Cryptolaemus montrouzieri]|uniref:Uncharacterized protein n=1 Tax=Cryptolaemus montrouzieri TaxID=559131 RepID=A0ABD2NMW0_9CUCU
MANLRGPLSKPRPRPVPAHHNPPKPKKPFLANLNRLIQPSPSVRPFWTNLQASYLTTEKPHFTNPTEKYQFVFPKIKKNPVKQKEYDYHVQTNQIPVGISSTHINPIQQVGEKGPIHTIPAPNLSPSDRPTHVEQKRPQIHNQQYNFETEQQFRHEYHVTEGHESPKHYVNVPQSQQNLEYYTQNIPPSSFQTHSFREPEQKITADIQFQQQQQLSGPGAQANKNSYYQVIQNVQQVSPESEEIPHQQFLQQIPNYHLFMSDKPQDTQQQHNVKHQQQQLISQVPQNTQQPNPYQQPLFIANPNYVQEYQQEQTQEPSDRINLTPEFHSFNYNEQDYQKQNSKSSLLTAGYNLDTEPEASNIVQQTIARNSEDSVAQSQFVQNYFDSKDDNLSTNDVDAEPKENSEISEENHEQVPGNYYSSLPNKQVAEALASLQAAGNINSNLMQLTRRGSERQKPMKIFVPEGSDESEKSENNYSIKQNDQDYEHENDDEEDNSEIMNTSFGDKIKPKRS